MEYGVHFDYLVAKVNINIFNKGPFYTSLAGRVVDKEGKSILMPYTGF